MEHYTCKEYINLENLNKMIKSNKLDEDTLRQLKALKRQVRNKGSHTVVFIPKDKFKKTKAIGRLYPKNNHPCLQGIKSQVRKALSYDRCVDLDIKNAHPIILNHILNQNNIECEQLKKYINNREDILNLYDDRDYGKQRYTSLINAGKPKIGHPDFEELFYQDVMQATEKLFKLSAYQYYIKKGELDHPVNPHGHAVSFLCQDFERKCMTSVIEKLKDLGYEPSTLIHDGLLVKTQFISDEHIKNIEEYLYKQTNFSLKLVVKPMNDFDETKLWDDDTKPDSDVSNDTEEAIKFKEHLTEEGHYFIRSKNTLFWFNPENGIWKMGVENVDIRRFIIDCEKLDPEFSKNLQKQNAIIGVFKSLIDVDDNFTTEAFITTYQKIPFNNGIWDFKESKLIPFSYKYRFFSKLKWDWGEIDESLQTEINQKVIYATFGEKIGNYYKNVLSRAIAGEVYDKLFNVIIGEGNSGKGVNADLFKAFGDFAGTFNAGQLCKKHNIIDEAKSKSWMVSIANKRIVFCSEIPLGTPIDQAQIKTLASGGDSISGRQNYKDEMTFSLECTPFAFLNDMPEIKGSDDAILNRMRYLETQFVYLPPDTYDLYDQKNVPSHIKKADPNIKHNFINRDDVLRTFAIMICKNYSKEQPKAPDEVMKATKEWTSADDISFKLSELFQITGKEDDFLTFKQLNSMVKHSNIEASSTRIGKIMKSIGIKKLDKKVNGKKEVCYVGIKEYREELMFVNDG